MASRYSLIAAAGAIPLLLMILLPAWFQFNNQREQLIEELEGEVIKHGTLFGNIIDTVRDHVGSLAAWTDIYREAPYLSAEATLNAQETANGVQVSLPAWRPADSRLFRKSGGTGREDHAEYGMAEGLVQHMRLAHRAMPYLRWSYYVADDRRFVTLYPLSRTETLGGALRTASDDQVVDIMVTQPLVTAPTAETSTFATPEGYWTPAFLDPAGAGWMVAHAIQVPAGSDRAGIVGSAVLLDFLTGFIRAFDYPIGKIWLVNDQRQILAASDGLVVSGLRLLTLDDVLPEPLKPIDIDRLIAPSRNLETFDGVGVFSRPISGTPWHLLYILEPGEATAQILPRFLPYGMILLGLLLTMLLAQFLRQRLLVGPALALADYIKAESQERPAPPPEVPDMWRPWIATVSEAFAAKHEANQRILESEAYFRTMAEAHPVPVAIVRLDDGRVLHASRAFAELLGTSFDDLVGTNIRGFYADPKDRDHVIRSLREKGGVQNFEHWVKRPDGTTFLASVSARPITFQGVDAVISGAVDLTEKRAAEAKILEQREALRQSEQRFRTIAEGHPVPVAIVRRSDQKVLYVSQPFADLLGVALQELYDADPRSFYANQDDRRRIAEILEERPSAENIEMLVKRPDGGTFPAAISCKVIDYEGDRAIVSSMVDLTEKKRADQEIARQRDALHQAEKLNALGSLLANVAHELNNPLSVVVGYATMQLEFSSDPASRERAEKIHAAAERCARIVKTFLAMARQKEAVQEPVQLNDVIESALEIAGYGLRTADVELDMHLASDLPGFLGDGDQLALVFMNLIVNAQHALEDQPPPKRLTITTGRDGQTIWAEFADNGTGVDAAIVSRIFEPFFTTKPQGVGTGIGLSVCTRIIDAHQGDISVASTLDRGALFRVTLPETEPVGIAPAVPPETDATPRSQGRILVVEDEPDLAEMVAAMLRSDGHDVTIAHSGRAALAIIDKQPLDLVVCDLRMPGLGGHDLHRLLSAQRPDMAGRMLFMTGDTLAYGLGDFFERTGLTLLEKPLEPATLQQNVRRLLDDAVDHQADSTRAEQH